MILLVGECLPRLFRRPQPRPAGKGSSSLFPFKPRFPPTIFAYTACPEYCYQVKAAIVVPSGHQSIYPPIVMDKGE